MLIFAHLVNHELYMHRCLQLAKLGAGYVAPNPMVGAVLVYDDRIIAEGYHRQYGSAHAEVNCINSVVPAMRAFIPQSTLYVSLEPCSHFGKTPPCTNLILEKMIKNVVVACGDPFEKVNGSGIQQLKTAGVNVIEGILEKEARELNRRFFTFHQKKRPYIVLKWAQTQDGFIAGPGFEPLAISNPCSNVFTHKMRAEVSAILVGTNTALHDNPSLSTRNWAGNNPLRMVIDKQLKLPEHLNLFTDGNATVVLNYLKEETKGPVYYHKVEKDQDLLEQLLKYLYEQQLQSLLVEGGSILLESFISDNCWDEAVVITNNNLHIKHGIKAPTMPAVKPVAESTILTDNIQIFRNL